MNPLLCFIRARLRRRLFAWFGATILVTGVAVGGVFGWSQAETWRRDYERVRTFAAGRFERVWDDPAARAELARAVMTDLGTTVELRDATERTLATFGPPCAAHAAFSAPVTRAGATLGYLRVCTDRYQHRPLSHLAPLLVAGLMLWGAAGAIARRLSRPLAELARVATDLGEGRLSSRVRLGRHHFGEAAVVGAAINRMAERVETHLAEQRELLAAVSHELRTPLGHIRLLTELARDRQTSEGGVAVADPKATAKLLDELDREVVEMDALVGDLLASARLEFAVLAPSSLDAAEVAARALQRAGLEASALRVETDDARVEADPTLLARALANLIDNASRHGGGLQTLRIARTATALRLEAEDGGAGFPPGEATRLFEPFYRRPAAGDAEATDKGSLGLGLALVKRIAEAHGGRAYAENRPGGGARVGLELPVVVRG